MSLSLGSCKSSPDENGNHHRLSIDVLSSKRHKIVTTFTAQIYSHNKNYDPRHRMLVIVKFPKETAEDSFDWAQCELQKAQLVRDVAAKFNTFVHHACLVKVEKANTLKERKVSILKPQMAALDSTSILARKMKKGDCFVCEDIIPGMSNFMDDDGKTACECSSSKSKKSMRLRTKQRTVVTRSTNAVSRPILIPLGERYSLSSTNSDSPPSYEESNCIENLKRYRSHSLCSESSNNSEHNIMTHCDCNAQASPQHSHPMICRAFETTLAMSEELNRLGSENYEDDSMVPHPLLQAFVHYFFCQTEGRHIVCNLKGSLENGKYTLTTPVIHSVEDYKFGDRDDGLEAVKSVIENHRCTWLCGQLPDMRALLEEP